MNTFAFAFIIAGLFTLAVIFVLHDVFGAIKKLIRTYKPKSEPIVYRHSWTTGIMLYGYDTDCPNGQLIGFDADYGYMFALNGKYVDIEKYVQQYSEDMSLPEPFTVDKENKKHHFNTVRIYN